MSAWTCRESIKTGMPFLKLNFLSKMRRLLRAFEEEA